MNDKNLEKDDLILTHGYIITMNEKREILKDGAISIKGEEITGVAPTKDLLEMHYSDNIKDLEGSIVHPGLIDAHEHTTMNLIRSWLPDDYSNEAMYKEFETPYFNNIDEDDEYYGTILACMEMILNGTTTFGDTGSTFKGKIDSLVEAVNKVGMKGRVGYIIGDQIDHMPMLNSSTGKCLEMLEYQIDRFPSAPGNTVGCWVGMMGIGECSDELLIKARDLAEKYNTSIHMHQSTFKFEVDRYIKKNHGILPINHLNELGILGPRTTLIHMIYLAPSEVELIRKTKTNIVHCPGASTRIGLSSSIYGSFPEMLKNSTVVALGSDQGICSDAFDIFKMAYLAAVIHKEARTETPAISAKQAFEMATINGAKVMGMDDEIGSLEVGKKADIVIHNNKHPESHPFFDPLNNLIFSAHSKSVDTVMVNGNIIVEDAEIKTLNAEEIFKEIDKKAVDLSRKMGFKVKENWPIV